MIFKVVQKLMVSDLMDGLRSLVTTKTTDLRIRVKYHTVPVSHKVVGLSIILISLR